MRGRIDRRRKDQLWHVAGEDGTVHTWDQVQVAVLMDIRDELKRLNAAIYCPNFTAIPRRLAQIASNTRRRPKKTRRTR